MELLLLIIFWSLVIYYMQGPMLSTLPALLLLILKTIIFHFTYLKMVV